MIPERCGAISTVGQSLLFVEENFEMEKKNFISFGVREGREGV